MTEEHVYESYSETVGNRLVSVKFPRLEEIRVTSSPDWWAEAPEGVISPQELLVAASASCIILSLFEAAHRMRISFEDVEIDSKDEMGENDGIWSFTKIRLNLKVFIKNEDDRTKIERAINLAHQSCPIANSLKTPTEIDYEIIVK